MCKKQISKRKSVVKHDVEKCLNLLKTKKWAKTRDTEFVKKKKKGAEIECVFFMKPL